MRLPFALLLLCWIGLTRAAGLLAADHLPDRIVSPLLWWGIDAGGADQGAAPDAPDLVATLTQWLAHPPASRRTLPEEGMRLGLLAVTPDAGGVMAPRVLHPPVALDAAREWPAQQRHRQVDMTTGVVLAGSGDWHRPWTLDNPADELQALLPLPPLPLELRQAWLILPLQEPPVDAVSVQLTLHDPSGLLADRQLTQQVTPHAGTLPLDLRAVLADWLMQGEAPPRLRLGIRAMPQRDSERGRWAPWSAQTPATWRLSWLELAHHGTGREQLRRVLAGLLTMPGQLARVSPDSLRQTMRMLLDGQAVPAEALLPSPQAEDSCLPPGGLLLGIRADLDSLSPMPSDAQRADAALQAWRLVPQTEPWPQDAGMRQLAAAQLPAALTRWQDWRLAPPARVTAWQPRLHATKVIGWDLISAQPVPGRQRWPGNLLVRPCLAGEVCADVMPSGAALDDGLGAFRSTGTPSLDDTGAVAGEPFVTVPGTAAGAAPAVGIASWIDDHDGPGHVLWLSADGEFILVDAAESKPRWRWLPSRWRAMHDQARQDLPSDESLPLPQAYVWAPDGQTRHVHAAVLGELVSLDLADVTRPRHLFRTDFPAGWLGSLSLFAAVLPEGRRHPFLLAASAPGAEPGLRLLDAVSGQSLWQAGSQDTPALSAGWRAPWAMLPEPGGGLRLYGVDSIGQVWRLPITRIQPLQIGPLQRVASLPSGPLTGSWDQPVSLAWMRQQGILVPVLAAIASRDADALDAALYAWLDLPADVPRPLYALPLWPHDSERPPEHDSGWRRSFATGERVMAAPRWLRQQLVVASSIRAADAGCGPPVWRQRLQVLPWRRSSSGASELQAHQAETDLPLPAIPLLGEDGSLKLPGETGAVLLPASAAGIRERLGKLPLPRR